MTQVETLATPEELNDTQRWNEECTPEQLLNFQDLIDRRLRVLGEIALDV